MNQIFFIHLPVVHIQALSTEVHFLMYTIQSSSSTPDCLPNRSQSMYPHKDLYVNVSRSFTCNSQKLGTTQVCTDEQRNWALSVQWMPLTGEKLTPDDTWRWSPETVAQAKKAYSRYILRSCMYLRCQEMQIHPSDSRSLFT